MKLTALGIVLALFILFITFFHVSRGQPTSFEGLIMDSRCAELGSHSMMMKARNMQTALQCALYCAHDLDNPAAWVLYDDATKTIYRITDQQKVQPYAAERVQILGAYDPATKTILPRTITAVP